MKNARYFLLMVLNIITGALFMAQGLPDKEIIPLVCSSMWMFSAGIWFCMWFVR